jgi:hypothetical protein
MVNDHQPYIYTQIDSQLDIWRYSYQDQQEGAGSVGHCAANFMGRIFLFEIMIE